MKTQLAVAILTSAAIAHGRASLARSVASEAGKAATPLTTAGLAKNITYPCGAG